MFCGYSIPHPFDNCVNLRLQTYEKNASDVLIDGLNDMKNICEIVKEKYSKALKEYKN